MIYETKGNRVLSVRCAVLLPSTSFLRPQCTGSVTSLASPCAACPSWPLHRKAALTPLPSPCLLLLCVLQLVFAECGLGAVVLTVNVILLGGDIVFFQALCLLGYCLFPMCLAAIVCAVTANKVSQRRSPCCATYQRRQLGRRSLHLPQHACREWVPCLREQNLLPLLPELFSNCGNQIFDDMMI